MITKVFAQGFKGLDFNQPLTARTVITGRVGSGKSARSLALALLVSGAIPGTGIARKAGDILDAVGNGDSLTVGLELDGSTTLERVFRRSGKTGAVKSEYRINGETVLKAKFDVVLEREGICIVDIPAFTALSDAKKVDELFKLFPPQGDVRGLTKKIADAAAELSSVQASIKGMETSLENITKSIAESALPAGSLPEIQAEIAKTAQEHQAARDEMVVERAAQQQREKEAAAAEQAAVNAEKQHEQQAEKPAQQESCNGFSDLRQYSLTEPQAQQPAQKQQQESPQPHVCQCGGQCKAEAVSDGVAALERVLAALEKAGCETCAAKMVLKRELKNMRNAGASNE